MEYDYRKQRALVLHGGGALGAYEAGVIYELYKILTKEDKIEGKAERPLFDVIIGTSIGATNAAVLVSQFLNKREHGLNISSAWQKAVEKLLEFWKYLSSPSIDIDEVQGTNPKFQKMIETWKRESEKGTPGVASKQAFEHYLFGKIALDKGVEKIYDRPEQIIDNRFFDTQKVWNMHNNDKLKDSIQNSENGATFPIKTSFNENDPQPRLLVVSVDIENGSTVTFDSYEKPDGTRKTMFVYNEKERKNLLCITIS